MRRSTWILAVLLAAAPAAAEAPREDAGAGPPRWFAEEMAFMVQGGGRWVAGNSDYRSESEPYDQYGMEWRYGLGEASITGRLFALKDGAEVATFWEFRSYWHPGERQVRAFQIGGSGAVGTGVMESAGPGRTRTTQTFHNPDGSTFSVGHESTSQGKEYITRSHDISPDGDWTPRRRYVWRLQEE